MKKENDKIKGKIIKVDGSKLTISGILFDSTKFAEDLDTKVITEIYCLAERASFSKQFFDLFPKVKKITIYNSKLESLPNNLFHSLYDLEYVQIQNTDLKDFPSNIFENNSKLRYLNLGKNMLEQVPDDLIQNNPELTNFYIFQNNLKSLSRSFFDNQEKLVDVSMSMNFGYQLLETAVRQTNRLILTKESLDLLMFLDDEERKSILDWMADNSTVKMMPSAKEVYIRISKEMGNRDDTVNMFIDFENMGMDEFEEKYEIVPEELHLRREFDRLTGIVDMAEQAPEYFGTFETAEQISYMKELVSITGH